MSTNESPDEAAVRLKCDAPRVSDADVEANIVDCEIVKHVSRSGQVLRWAVLTTRSGFAVTGEPSASVSPENDRAELGEKYARENAKRVLWKYMAYELKTRLAFTAALDRPTMVHTPKWEELSELTGHQLRRLGWAYSASEMAYVHEDGRRVRS